MTADLKLEIHQPSIHKNRLRSTASISVFLLLTKRHVSHLSTKKTKNTATEKKTGGREVWEDVFLVRCVPFNGPWDLGLACA